MNETKICQNCKRNFKIEPEDFAFYSKMQVPPPTFCPECRMRRRLIWRNERSLYKRKCGLCGVEQIMAFAPDALATVYCRDCWLGDKWDPKSYGRDYDFTRPFFEQFNDILKTVPRPGIIKQKGSIDSEYTHRVTDMRGCYLVFGTTVAEFSQYGSWLNYSKEITDGSSVQHSERCYECIDCHKCVGLKNSQECNECQDSMLLLNCRNCTNCFGCVNLRNKKYCIWNKEYSKEEYEKKIKAMNVGSRASIGALKVRFEEFRKQFIVPWMVTRHSVNSTGNWIENSKNIYRSFSCLNVEDARYSFALLEGKDFMDFCHWGATSEQIYESINCGIECANLKFCNECWMGARDFEYCMNCHGSHDLFGCVGIRNGEYCILNKQYSKEDYEKLVAKIKAQMNELPYVDAQGKTYRYGEFYPVELSPFAYNESVAQEFFPLDRASMEKKGYRFREPEKRQYATTLKFDELPDRIEDVDDEVLKQIIECAHQGNCDEQCTAAFRIIPAELQFYRQYNIALPTLCPNCRHYARLKKRNPLKLWHRKCNCAGTKSENDLYANTIAHVHGSDHCPNEFETSYSLDRPEIVYCEACYQQEVV